MKVQHLMTSPVYVVYVDDALDLVDSVMKLKKIHHIPVVDKSDQVHGMLTHRDLLRASVSAIADITDSERTEILSGIPVREIMSKDLYTVAPDDDLRTAVDLMLSRRIGGLPVVNEGKLVGILTEADFLRLADHFLTMLDNLRTFNRESMDRARQGDAVVGAKG